LKAFILRSVVNKHGILSQPLYCNLYSTHNSARYELLTEGKKKFA
jgi:hypothetical protein